MFETPDDRKQPAAVQKKAVEMDVLLPLYVEKIGPLRPQELDGCSAKCRANFLQIATPRGLLVILSPRGRKLVGYKNPWKPTSEKFAATRFETRRLIEHLAAKADGCHYRDKFRGSVLVECAATSNRYLAAAYLARVTKPTLWSLYERGRFLGAQIVVSFPRSGGGPRFNLIKEGLISYVSPSELPTEPPASLDLVKYR